MPSKIILLDNCVPRPLKRELRPHAVSHVTELGWENFDDGPLLKHAARDFDVLITTDQNLPYQQNLSRYDIAVIVLIAFRNRIDYLQPFIPEVLDILKAIQPGDVYEVS
ncbi:MAG: DUF5615 family PIN-like protein [Pyrinomonadaceae bacterium]